MVEDGVRIVPAYKYVIPPFLVALPLVHYMVYNVSVTYSSDVYVSPVTAANIITGVVGMVFLSIIALLFMNYQYSKFVPVHDSTQT